MNRAIHHALRGIIEAGGEMVGGGGSHTSEPRVRTTFIIPGDLELGGRFTPEELSVYDGFHASMIYKDPESGTSQSFNGVLGGGEDDVYVRVRGVSGEPVAVFAYREQRRYDDVGEDLPPGESESVRHDLSYADGEVRYPLHNDIILYEGGEVLIGRRIFNPDFLEPDNTRLRESISSIVKLAMGREGRTNIGVARGIREAGRVLSGSDSTAARYISAVRESDYYRYLPLSLNPESVRGHEQLRKLGVLLGQLGVTEYDVIMAELRKEFEGFRLPTEPSS